MLLTGYRLLREAERYYYRTERLMGNIYRKVWRTGHHEETEEEGGTLFFFFFENAFLFQVGQEVFRHLKP